MANQLTSTVAEPGQAGHWYKVNHDETAASRPRTIQALHNEHVYMFNLLDSLNEQVGYIVSGEDADFNLLLDIVDYMQNFPDRYHHPKEDIIYQRMALRDSDVARDVLALLDEHRILKKLIDRLADAIRDVHTLPTVLKKQRAGELCAEYELRLRDHINTEEGQILPRALEVLREEDWFLIDQNSTPINEIPIDNILTDNYAALRRFLKGNTEKLANNVVLAEFLSSHSLLELFGGLGAHLNYGSQAYRQGVRQGLSAYVGACKSWIPTTAENREHGVQNPLRVSWKAFLKGMSEMDKPDVELLEPMRRALGLYTALIGGRGKAIDGQGANDDAELDLNSLQFVEDMGKLLQKH
jgi:hemerythrin-like domain-containing protein